VDSSSFFQCKTGIDSGAGSQVSARHSGTNRKIVVGMLAAGLRLDLGLSRGPAETGFSGTAESLELATSGFAVPGLQHMWFGTTWSDHGIYAVGTTFAQVALEVNVKLSMAGQSVAR
jgi:hypothetical protein